MCYNDYSKGKEIIKMTINFENYGRFYCSLAYVNNDVIDYRNESAPHSLRECADFIEYKMEQDSHIILGIICDWDTGYVVATIERESENEDFEPADIDDDCGFDPYEGCFTFDC